MSLYDRRLFIQVEEPIKLELRLRKYKYQDIKITELKICYHIKLHYYYYTIITLLYQQLNSIRTYIHTIKSTSQTTWRHFWSSSAVHSRQEKGQCS